MQGMPMNGQPGAYNVPPMSIVQQHQQQQQQQQQQYSQMQGMHAMGLGVNGQLGAYNMPDAPVQPQQQWYPQQQMMQPPLQMMQPPLTSPSSSSGGFAGYPIQEAAAVSDSPVPAPKKAVPDWLRDQLKSTPSCVPSPSALTLLTRPRSLNAASRFAVSSPSLHSRCLFSYQPHSSSRMVLRMRIDS